MDSSRFGEIGTFYIIKASKINERDMGYVVDFNTCELNINPDWRNAYTMQFPFDAEAMFNFLKVKFEDYEFELLQIKIETKKYIGG